MDENLDDVELLYFPAKNLFDLEVKYYAKFDKLGDVQKGVKTEKRLKPP